MKNPANKNPDDLPLIEPNPEATYTLDVVAEITGVSSQTILHYQEKGLIRTIEQPESGKHCFDDESLRAIRRVEHLRHEMQLSEPALKLISNLLTEIEDLRAASRQRQR